MKNNLEDKAIELCKEHGVAPKMPSNDQLIVVSQGVFEGEKVEAVRYPSPHHMSGWWITTKDYNGDVSTLLTQHFSHLIEKRPDLIRFMALPCGFRFFEQGYNDHNEDVWNDPEVSKMSE